MILRASFGDSGADSDSVHSQWAHAEASGGMY
jgi:hypothetical protein